MKTVLLLFLLITFTTTQSFAQAASGNDDKLLFLQKAEKFRKMKATGTTLTVGGSILMVAGLVTLLNSSIETTYDGYGNYTETVHGNPIGGAIMWIGGNLAVGAGIPLSIIGKNNQRKYNRKAEGITFKIKATQQYSGVTLAYKF